MSWYIYTHSNKAAHVLISNSILANRFTPDSFKCESLGFIGQEYIFATPLQLVEDLQQIGTDDIYAPVAFEITFKADDPVYPVYLTTDSNDHYTLGELCAFATVQSDPTVVGVFIYGEIPVTMTTRILFLSDDDRINFYNPSEDIWYPKELCQIWNQAELQDDLDTEALYALLPSLEAKAEAKLRRIIVSRQKTKTAMYQAIKATFDWTQRGACGNCDSALAQMLDRKDSRELTEAYKIAYKQVVNKKACSGGAISALLRIKDPVLNPKKDDIHRKLFARISKCIIDGELSSHKEFNFENVQKQCMLACRRIRKTTLASIDDCFRLIKLFLDGEMDIDDVIAAQSLQAFPELAAVMMVLKQPKNSVYFERACSVLPQDARRYAYMIFGMLNGMPSINGQQKSNRVLERRLEEIVLSSYSHPIVISRAPSLDENFFRTVDDNQSKAHGLTVILHAV